MLNANQHNIIYAILGNEKRMTKLNSIKSSWDKRDQIHKYVVAECQTQKVKLSNEEMLACSAWIMVRG